MRSPLPFIAATVLALSAAAISSAAERDPLAPRVPPDKIEEARVLKNPVPRTRETIRAGKQLFEGKGTCHNCHGKTGRGDGLAGQILNPSPRNFTNCAFHRERTDGELFWVIRHGSPDTGMIAMIPRTVTEDEAWTIIHYLRTFCKKPVSIKK
jgi:mono/diheme cytochrome c family protein